MTSDGAALLAALPAWSFTLVLVLARCGGAIALMPGLGETAPPVMVRAGLALAISILLLPDIRPLLPPAPEPGLLLAALIVSEFVTGLWLGWLARVLVLALPIGAQFIAYQMGTSSVLQPDAELGPQTSALARVYDLAAPLIILVSGLYTLPLSALVGSYRLIPPGGVLPAADSTATVVRAVGDAFALAFRLAGPFVLAGIVWHVTVGAMTRLIPRVQIYFLTMPGQILGGFALLATLSTALVSAFVDAVRDGLSALPGAG